MKKRSKEQEVSEISSENESSFKKAKNHPNLENIIHPFFGKCNS